MIARIAALRPASNQTGGVPLSASTSGSCVKPGPALLDPVFLVLQNANSVTSYVTVTNAFDPSTYQPGTVSVTVPPGGSYSLNIIDPANSKFQASADTPIRAACYYTTRDPDLNVLTWAAIVGAAALFFEVTVSSLNPVPAQTATKVQTITVAHPDRLARN